MADEEAPRDSRPGGPLRTSCSSQIERRAVANRCEAVRSKECIEATEHACLSTVVPNLRQKRNVETRLPGIPFPGVRVKRPRLPAPRRLSQGCVYKSPRKQPKVRTPSSRERHSTDAKRRGWQLSDAASGPLNPVRISRTTRISVALPADGKQRRIVAIPFLDEDIERPLRSWHNRKARRAKSPDGAPRLILKQALGASHRISERRLCLVRDTHVIVCMRREFVPFRREAAHQGLLALRHPSDGKERAAYVMRRH